MDITYKCDEVLFFIIIINMGVRTSLRTPRLILQALKLTIIQASVALRFVEL
jgi:hypothetical protein